MSLLIEKLMKNSKIKESAVLAKSAFFNAKEVIPTDLPVLNIAFSGTLTGGLLPGLTVFAGLSKSFKSALALYCMKAYLDKHKDGIAIFYDSEFGVTPDYIASFGIDIDRVLHIPITNIEELKFDLVAKLEDITKKDKVFIMIDSVGNTASKKELEDAQNEKSVADMSRAKSIKSLFRIITPQLTTKNIPCIAINHVYMSMELYSKAIMSGGSGILYAANSVFIITKSQEKVGTEVQGWNFTINIEKSRYVKEKSKLTFTVMYNKGIQKWSSLFELAQEANYIIKPKVGWYQLIDPETGEVSTKNYREAEIEKNDAFFEKLIASEKFQKFVEHKYKLTNLSEIDPDSTLDSNLEEVDIEEDLE
jgi:RecA/RadA recombinase